MTSSADSPPPDNASGNENNDDETLQVQVHRHTVRKRLVGRRLDKYLRGRYPRISRTTLQRYIKQGQVTINGLPTKPSYEPAAGDLVEIRLPPPPPTDLVPEDIPLDIIYEDEWLLAINKQPGIICHPARATQSGTVANAVAFHAEQLSRGSEPFRPGIMHRLDKNTTGILVIAKTDEAHWRIALQFERRTMRKEYFAICEGEISLDGDVINKPLSPHPQTTKRMILPSASPPRQAMFKEAITEYQVEKRYRGYTTVNLFPKTGRTHQLRVHMSSIGHPMVGDTLYGGRPVSEMELTGSGSSDPLIEYQALHARRLSLMHPILERPLNLEAPISDKIRRIHDLLEQSRRL
jgi:23S rRNA pseudouridine1911/1915/1917 synthase